MNPADDAVPRRDGEAEVFAGLPHARVFESELPDRQELVDGIVEAGTVGTIAALPGTYKTWLAMQIAVAVASGAETVLGREVVCQGRVGYFWSDDSTGNEVARIEEFHRVRSMAPDLPLVWFLNAGLRLPEDLPKLRATIERHSFDLLILDSFYNFATGVNLKEEDAARIIVAIKQEICDVTGCSVLIVDHAPWPSESNRRQRRAYGSVFKAAAIRWCIHIQREGSKLFVEARGNNIRGLVRTLAEWDEERLELRLVGSTKADEAKLDERVYDYVCKHSGCSSNELENGVTGARELIRGARDRLEEAGRITNRSPEVRGRGGGGHRWYPSNHAGSEFAGLHEANLGELTLGTSRSSCLAGSPPPLKGASKRRGELLGVEGVESGDGDHSPHCFDGEDDPDAELDRLRSKFPELFPRELGRS